MTNELSDGDGRNIYYHIHMKASAVIYHLIGARMLSLDAEAGTFALSAGRTALHAYMTLVKHAAQLQKAGEAAREKKSKKRKQGEIDSLSS